MLQPDFETEQKTLVLRDAFRVLAWEIFETNPKNREDLNLRYTRFYSRWTKSEIRSMDLGQLKDLAVEKGFSVEQLLFYRECYYSIAQPYPPEIFLSND